MRVAIAILNWNGKSFLEKFLPDVIQHSPDYAEVYVIDNGSSDDSIKYLTAEFPSVKVIALDKNHGFAMGYNEGLKKIQAEYFVLLNSDVQVTRQWMEPVISLMDSDKRIGACQPKLLNYSVRNEFEYAGGAGGFIDKYGYPFCRGRIFNSFEKDNRQYDDSREVFWASGACLFVRSSVFYEAGRLDEDFFAHMEEIDLCWRIKNLGYKIMYCSQSTVYHVGGGTLSMLSPRKTFLNFRNNLILLCKNHAPGFFLLKILLRMKLDAIAGLRFILNAQVAHFFAVLNAHFSFYSTLGRTLRKRKAMKKRISIYSATAIYRRSIVWDYFVRRKRKFSELDSRAF